MPNVLSTSQKYFIEKIFTTDNIDDCNIPLSGHKRNTCGLRNFTVAFSVVWLLGCAADFSTISDELEDIESSTPVYLDEDNATSLVDDSAEDGLDTAGTDSNTNFDSGKDTEVVHDTIEGLDDKFGVSGKFLYPSELGNDSAIDAVTAPDGSIFITGILSNGTDSDLLLMKLTSDGVLDTTFNGTGYITRHNIAGGNGSDAGYSINLSPDGDLLISGRSDGPGGYGLGFLWKVSTSGVDDASFGSSGTYLLDIGKNLKGIRSTYDNKTGNIFAVAEVDWLIHGFRILADGSGLDLSFGGDGMVELYPTKAFAPVVNALSGGTLMVAGICQAGGGGWDACSWLLDTDGDLIPSYTNYNDQTRAHVDLAGGNGNDSWNAVVPYPQNRIVLAGASLSGSNSEDELIARVNVSDGSLDTSFGGGDGFWTADALGLGTLGRVHDAIVRQDGSIVAALEFYTAAGDWDVAVIKLDADGVRDMSFASGTGALQLGGAYQDRGPRIIEQPDGRILVFTSQYNEAESDIVMWAVL